MSYTKDQIELAIKSVRIRFFRSAIAATIFGIALLYAASIFSKGENQFSLLLFVGFIVGFAAAGLILPQGFRSQLYK